MDVVIEVNLDSIEGFDWLSGLTSENIHVIISWGNVPAYFETGK